MIYVYDDPSGWGREVSKYTTALRFADPNVVPAGETAFVRLDQSRNRREVSKSVVRRLHENGVRVAPSVIDAQLYDDKLSQRPHLSRWMPLTLLVEGGPKSVLDAVGPAIGMIGLPFVSKSADGSSSANVRLIETEEQAREEARQVFSGGMEIRYGRKQEDYLLWQKFVPYNDRDYRVCFIGNDAFGIVRRNRPDVPFALGSGDSYPMTLDDHREATAFSFATHVRSHLRDQGVGEHLVAFDIVFNDYQPMLLELTSSWTPSVYEESPVFAVDGSSQGYTGREMFRMIAKHLEEIDV